MTARVCTRCGARVSRDRALSTPEELLVGLLETAVSAEVHQLARLAWADVERVARESAEVVAAHADDLQFGGKHCRKAFAATARGLAALAFAPGGAHFLGSHWCAVHPDAGSRRTAQYAGAQP